MSGPDLDAARLASPCNIWATTEDDVRILARVSPGTRVTVERG